MNGQERSSQTQSSHFPDFLNRPRSVPERASKPFKHKSLKLTEFEAPLSLNNQDNVADTCDNQRAATINHTRRCRVKARSTKRAVQHSAHQNAKEKREL